MELGKKRGKYLSIESIVAIIAIFISLVALGVSIKSCLISQESQDLNKKIFNQERQLILTGKFESDFSMTVLPVDNTFSFLEGTLYFPTEIYSDEVPIDSNGNLWHTGSIEFEVKKYLKSIVSINKNHIIVSDQNIPIIIDSYYAVKGESYSDRSVYALRLISTFASEKYKDPSVKIKSIIFLQRLQLDETDPHEILNNYIKISSVKN